MDRKLDFAEMNLFVAFLTPGRKQDKRARKNQPNERANREN